MPTLKAGACALALLALFSGCRVGFVRRGTKPKPSPSVATSPFTYGSEFEIPEAGSAAPEAAPAAAAPASGDGRLELTLSDQNKLNPSGIPIDMSGVINGRFHSNEKGRFVFSAKPGRFGAQIPTGCIGPLLMQFGPSTGGVLVGGQTLRGAMTVEWQHKIAPGFGAYPSKSPYWPVGETITIYYDVIDRCANDKAPNVDFEPWSFRTSTNLEVAAPPVFRTNSNAQAMVQVRCKAPGRLALVAVDSANPSDEFNFQKAMLIFGESEVSCS